jgi:GntR family transcriptional regulator
MSQQSHVTLTAAPAPPIPKRCHVVDRRSFLSEPLARDSGVPLRVKAHSRILDGIRSGVLPPGSMMPTEMELGQLLGVSRTVIREALMLLEEDGFIFSRRGVGRFVADAVPQMGLERIRPLEELLSTATSPMELRRSEVTLQRVSATFVAEALGISGDDPTWFFETVLSRDGEAVALSQEHLPAGGRAGTEDLDAFAAAMAPENGGTLLSLLLDRFGSSMGPGVLSVTLGVLGESRAALLGTGPSEPAMVVTQSVALRGRPFYLGKHMILSHAGQLSVLHAGP